MGQVVRQSPRMSESGPRARTSAFGRIAPPLMRKIQDDMDISGETATLSDFGVRGNNRLRPPKVLRFENTTRKGSAPAAPAACRGIQWGTVAGYAQCAPGQHLRHQEIVFQACRFALIPDRGGIDILLSRLGKDYGPLQGKLRSMRFLTASQGWAFCASCS